MVERASASTDCVSVEALAILNERADKLDVPVSGTATTSKPVSGEPPLIAADSQATDAPPAKE